MNVLFDQGPWDGLDAVPLNHGVGNIQIIRGRECFKSLWNKDFHASCYLFVLSPAFEIPATNCGDCRGKPREGQFVFAVNNSTTEGFVVVSTSCLLLTEQGTISLQASRSVMDEFFFDFGKFMKSDWFMVCGVFVDPELKIRPCGV